MSDRQAKRRKSGRRVKVLFTCGGRRIELIDAFRRAARQEKMPLTVIVADASPLAAAMHAADVAHVVPRIPSRDYIPSITRIVQRDRPDLLIPLIDSDLLPLSRARETFGELGCCALISSPTVVRTCRDKLRTYKFLCRQGIDTPATWTLDEATRRRRHRFPYFIKPRYGSAGRGSAKVPDLETLRFWGRRVPSPIVQEFVGGPEMTLDVYAGFDGTPRCVVPRERLEVRAGEVSKGRVVKDRTVIETGRRVVAALGGCLGVVTIQCIVDARRRVRVIEINPRFGGGVPLAIAAGADFPRWLLMEFCGRRPRIPLDGYRDGLHMLRFDRSVFVSADDFRRI